MTLFTVIFITIQIITLFVGILPTDLTYSITYCTLAFNHSQCLVIITEYFLMSIICLFCLDVPSNVSVSEF